MAKQLVASSFGAQGMTGQFKGRYSSKNHLIRPLYSLLQDDMTTDKHPETKEIWLICATKQKEQKGLSDP